MGERIDPYGPASAVLDEDPGRDPARVAVLLPVRDDWESLALLLPLLDRELTRAGRRAEVVVVDDGSEVEGSVDPSGFEAIEEVRIVRLRRNLGHQRAIAVGLCHLHAERPGLPVVVMDADGEDDPADVPRLLDELERAGRSAVVFARRERRSEGLLFKALYLGYRQAHLLLTGIPVRVGNFSALPGALLGRLVVAEELWNHYAATVHKLRLPRRTIPADRARRLRGRSRMSWLSLVIHGLSAISVFSEQVGVRLLAASGILALSTVLGIGAVASVRLGTDLAIPGWASFLVGILLVALLQSLLLSLVFVFVVLSGRSGTGCIPARDCAWFVDRVDTVRAPATAR